MADLNNPTAVLSSTRGGTGLAKRPVHSVADKPEHFELSGLTTVGHRERELLNESHLQEIIYLPPLQNMQLIIATLSTGRTQILREAIFKPQGLGWSSSTMRIKPRASPPVTPRNLEASTSCRLIHSKVRMNHLFSPLSALTFVLNAIGRSGSSVEGSERPGRDTVQLVPRLFACGIHLSAFVLVVALTRSTIEVAPFP